MRIMITGVAGFLGCHLARRMLSRGCEVVGVDNLVGGYLDNVPSEVEFHVADCNRLKRMTQLSRGCHVVYHCACTAYEGLSVFSPCLITKNTFQCTSSLLCAAVRNEVRRFVFCSSMARYGQQPTLPFTEDMECRPQDPYGIAKYSAELLVKTLCEVHGMEYVIAVPHNIIGPRQKYDDPYRNVAAIMINRMLQGQQPIIYGDGQQQRCFSFIDDVVDCLEQMATNGDVSGEVINIGPDEDIITVNRLAELLAERLGFDLRPMYVPARPQEVRFANCSAAKARALLGYQTKTRLEDGLDSMIRYIRRRGPRPFAYHLDLEITNAKCPITWSGQLV